MKISPSILAADLTDLKRILGEMDPAEVDFIHLDVMDGHFVPTLSFGEAYAAHLGRHTTIPLDVHLMVDRPEEMVPRYFDLQPHNITFHIEATNSPIRLSQLIRERGIKAGIALNPGTPVEHLSPVLDYIDLILLMSVEPGYYGQKFLPHSLGRAAALTAMIGDRDILLEVDGGVGGGNIRELAEQGVRMAVAGSSAFSSGNVNDNVRALKQAAAQPIPAT